MSDKTLYLFTQKFPFKGGETFLETEILYLSAAFNKIVVFPAEQGQEYYAALPLNVEVGQFEFQSSVRIRNILRWNFQTLAGYYFRAIFFSQDRWKYFTQFRFNFNRILGLFSRAGELFNHFKINNSNIFYYSYWFNDWASMLAICRRKGLKGRFIVRAHGYDYDVLQNGRGYFPFRESEMTQFDKMVQISEYGIFKMRKQYPQAKNLILQKLGVVDNGINPVSEDGAKYRIVSCSNFVKLKRLPLIIDILSVLDLDFEWVHFGWGEGADDIVKLAGQKLKSGSFEFRGITPNAEILRYYRENPVDLVINVSELEGIPVSLMEAVASGIPVAGYNICGVPEIVCKETGLLLNNEPNPKDTAIQIKSFLEGKARNLEFRRGVKSFWEMKYNAYNNYIQFIKIITNA